MPKLMIEEMDKVWFNFNFILTGKVDNNIDHRKSQSFQIWKLIGNYVHKKIRGIRKRGS